MSNTPQHPTPAPQQSTSTGSVIGSTGVAIGPNAQSSVVTLPPRPDAPPPAFQVPYPKSTLFVGRDALLAQLGGLLVGQGPRVIALHGPGGVGKTQFASEVAHAYREHFTGGVFWLGMEQAETIGSQVAACAGPGGLELYGWQAMDGPTREAAVRAAWHDNAPRLLIFDNLEDPALLRWCPTSGGARVLITSRRGVWGAATGVYTVVLPMLARADSMQLLLLPRARQRATTPDTLLADPAIQSDADAICEMVGDLPLALALAGGYLESAPSVKLGSYRARLQQALLADASLSALPDEGLPTGYARGVAAAIELSYQQLNPAAAADAQALQLLQRMAYCAPAPTPQRLLVRLLDADPDDEEQAATLDAPLRRLRVLGLADASDEGAALHRLVAAYARERGTDSEADDKAVENALIDEVGAINRAGYPLRGTPYLPHLEMAAQRADKRADEQGALLLNELGYLLQDLGELAAARSYFERALAIREQVLGAEHPDTASSLNNLGSLLQDLGELAAARPCYERALAIREQVLGGEHPDTAQSLNNLGSLLRAQGKLAAAKPYYERALAIREEVLGGEHSDTAQSLNNLGYLLQDLGELAAARPCYERALAIREQVLGGEHPDTAQSLNNLGSLLQDLGELAGARPYYERALAIREQVLGGEHPDTAQSLNNLGALVRAQGELAGARPYLERALAICERALGPEHPNTKVVRGNLAALRAELGDAPPTP